MERYTYFDGGKWRLKIGDTEYSGDWVNRLAAYEETRLEPEEIERILDSYGRGMTLRTENAQRLEIIKEIPINRLRELAQAEKEGRLVVLSEPMKPMVYKPNDTDVYCPSCGESLSGGWPLSDTDDLNSVYTRSGQNSTPNSNATNLHSSQKRCCSFCISSSNASPTFQVQKSIFHQMTKPIQVTVILPLLLAISFSRNDDIHSSISGISNDLIGVIPTIGQ